MSLTTARMSLVLIVGSASQKHQSPYSSVYQKPWLPGAQIHLLVDLPKLLLATQLPVLRFICLLLTESKEVMLQKTIYSQLVLRRWRDNLSHVTILPRTGGQGPEGHEGQRAGSTETGWTLHLLQSFQPFSAALLFLVERHPGSGLLGRQLHMLSLLVV